MKKNKSPSWLTSVGIILVVVAIVLSGWFFLRGKTTVTGSWNNNEIIRALNCETSDIDYSFISTDGARNRNAEVNVTFNGNSLATMSFIYRLSYDNKKEASDSKNVNHAEMNIKFGKDGLGADAFNARYSAQDNIMQMNLYTTSKGLDAVSSKYFFLNGLSDDFNYQVVKDTYENLGFICTTVNQ